MLNNSHIIIDGNNLIHRHPELSRLARSDFDSARHRLVSLLDGFSEANQRITVAFDGKTSGPAPQFTSSSVGVEFSAGHLSADTVIERMVMQASSAAQITVVTSDRGERDMVEASGGNTMSCIAFIELLEDGQQKRKAASTRKRAPKNTLGDLFPDGDWCR